MQAPAATAAAMTSSLLVSMEMATSSDAAMRSMTGTTRSRSIGASTPSEPGPRRFPAHIDDGGALRHHLRRALERRLDAGIAAAVGERIRRHVENAHDDRARRDRWFYVGIATASATQRRRRSPPARALAERGA